MASDYKEVLAAASLMSGRTEDEILSTLVMEKYGKAYETLEARRRPAVHPQPVTLPLSQTAPAVAHGKYAEEWGRTLNAKAAASCAACIQHIKVGQKYRRKVSKSREFGDGSGYYSGTVIEVGAYYVRIRHEHSGRQRRTSITRGDSFATPNNSQQNKYKYHLVTS